MQLTTERRSLTAEGVAGARQFTVSPNAHLFAILSGLYSNIPFAIFREYSTNMLDGYIALKRDRPGAEILPPVIHFPTTLEPWIEFKDFGIGMSFETVWHVFTAYAASTKNTKTDENGVVVANNDEVGGFGLGAKTAFCYEGCDQWTVESRYDGQKMLFAATKDASGIPSMFHIATTPTDEPNGVSVRIPVAQADGPRFLEAARALLPYYPMDVTLVGAPGLTVKKPEYFLQGDGWGLRTVDRTHSQVIMGNVPYPLDWHQAGLSGVKPYDFNYSLAIDLTLPVGSVDLVPSRDSLKYTGRTIAAVKKAWDAAWQGVRAQAAKDLATITSEWEAVKKLHQWSRWAAINQALVGVTWRGKTLDINKGYVVTRTELRKTYPDLTIRKIWNDKGISFSDMQVEKIELHPSWHHQYLYLNDVERGEFRRVRAVLLDKVVELDYNDRRRAKDTAYGYLVTATGLTPEKLSKLLGDIGVVKVSDLGEPAKAAKTTKLPVQIKKLSYNGWVNANVKIEDGGVYVRMERNTLADRPGMTLADLRSTIDRARVLGLLPYDFTLYGVPRTRSDVEDEKGWTEFFATLQPKVEAAVKQQLPLARTQQEWGGYVQHTLTRFARRANDAQRALIPELQVVLDGVEAAEKVATSKTDAARMLAHTFGIKWDVPVATQFAALYKDVRARVPAIGFFADYVHHYNFDAAYQAYATAIWRYVEFDRERAKRAAAAVPTPVAAAA